MVLPLAAALASGCFYTDPINQRPSATIVRLTATPHHGESVTLHVDKSDPDQPSDTVDVYWKAQQCGPLGGGCDDDNWVGPSDDFTAQVEATLTSGLPTASIAITIDARDSHNAHAHPSDRLVLDVQDFAPTASVQASSASPRGTFPVGLPITLFASGKDDDKGDRVAIEWPKLPFPPAGSDPNLVEWSEIPDPAHPGQHGAVLVPDVAGEWQIDVVANDGLMKTTNPFKLTVAPDAAPCLAITEPGLGLGSILVDQARRFSVLQVDDDINGYPRAAIPTKATATFSWSLASKDAGGGFAPIATDADHVVIDPARYRIGDELDLRVEIHDDTPRDIACDASKATCAIDPAQPSCTQRQTWHLQIGGAS